MIYILGSNEFGTYFSTGDVNYEDPLLCKGMIVVMKCGHIIDRRKEFPNCNCEKAK